MVGKASFCGYRLIVHSCALPLVKFVVTIMLNFHYALFLT